MSWGTIAWRWRVFARISAPQVRLTKDPEHVLLLSRSSHKAPPFRLQDDTTWDTNLELGIYWGLRLIERDEEIQAVAKRQAVRR